MRRALAALAIGLAAATTSAVAAGKGWNSLDPVKGRFHVQHVQKLKQDCASCHADTQKDLLFGRKDLPLPAAMPGPVDRGVCLSCHQPANKKAPWYGRAASERR